MVHYGTAVCRGKRQFSDPAALRYQSAVHGVDRGVGSAMTFNRRYLFFTFSQNMSYNSFTASEMCQNFEPPPQERSWNGGVGRVYPWVGTVPVAAKYEGLFIFIYFIFLS